MTVSVQLPTYVEPSMAAFLETTGHRSIEDWLQAQLVCAFAYWRDAETEAPSPEGSTVERLSVREYMAALHQSHDGEECLPEEIPDYDVNLFSAFLAQGSPEFWARPRPLEATVAAREEIRRDFPLCCGDHGAVPKAQKSGGMRHERLY